MLAGDSARRCATGTPAAAYMQPASLNAAAEFQYSDLFEEVPESSKMAPFTFAAVPLFEKTKRLAKDVTLRKIPQIVVRCSQRPPRVELESVSCGNIKMIQGLC